MPENTYKLIKKIRVGSGGASDMEFTSIPQSYKHLILHIVSRTNRSGVYQDNLSISYNGSSSSQTDRRIFGDTSSVTSFSDSALYSGLATASSTGSNIYGSTTIFISNYSGDTYKSSSSDGGAPHDGSAGGLNLGARTMGKYLSNNIYKNFI